MGKYFVLMIIVFGLLAIDYMKITSPPRTPEEDKQWVVQDNV